MRFNKQLIAILLMMNFVFSCYTIQAKEPQKPQNVPEKAKWFDKKNKWIMEDSDGVTTFWYSNGNKESQGKLVNDKIQGLYIKWYENGNKKMEGFGKDDLLEGLWVFWWQNGKVKMKGTYKEDKEEGLWELYDENGQKIAELIYKNGVMISEKKFNKD